MAFLHAPPAKVDIKCPSITCKAGTCVVPMILAITQQERYDEADAQSTYLRCLSIPLLPTFHIHIEVRVWVWVMVMLHQEMLSTVGRRSMWGYERIPRLILFTFQDAYSTDGDTREYLKYSEAIMVLGECR